MRRSHKSLGGRLLTLSLIAAIMPACTSTRVVETDWEDQAADELNYSCAGACRATVYTPEPIEATRLSIRNSILAVAKDPSAPITDLSETSAITRISVTRKNHGIGAAQGLGIGLAAGALVGALVGAMSWEPCTDTGWFACFMHPDSRGGAAALGGAAGGSLGGLLGLIFGGISGQKEVRIYEYRPTELVETSR